MTTASRTIRVGNAPVSWGVYEAGEPKNPPYTPILDAIAEAGYDGTELGPYGYLPTDPVNLRAELSKRNLALGSSFVATPLERADKRAQSVAHALVVARLLASQGVDVLIIAAVEDATRKAIAGRVPRDNSAGYDDAAWREAATTLHEIARAARSELGMKVVVHHHAGTMIETPAEIERLLAETDPELVNLLLDTGHAVYGGGDPLDIVARFGKRVTYLHYKDVNPGVLARVRTTPLHMEQAWKDGVFCPLGQGSVNFPQLTERLRAQGYGGWVIVEQDVVPDDKGELHPEPFDSAKKSRAYLESSCGI